MPELGAVELVLIIVIATVFVVILRSFLKIIRSRKTENNPQLD